MPEQPGDSFRPLEVAQMPDRNPSLQTITSLPIGAILTDLEGRRERALAVTVAQASVLDGPTEKNTIISFVLAVRSMASKMHGNSQTRVERGLRCGARHSPGTSK